MVSQTVARAWLPPLLMGLMALAVRLPHLDEPAHFDELYHLLAAQSWLAEGELRIAEGIYDRTSLFTITIAAWMRLFGDSLEVARLPSVFAGTALVVAAYLWVKEVAGTPAAWIAALLLALWPDGIHVSQFLRFYALQGLLFWLGAIALYRLISRSFDPWTAAAGAAALLAAVYLQAISLIGILGLGLWVGLVLGVPWARRAERQHLAAAGGVVALAAGAILWSGIGTELIAWYRTAPLWNQEQQDTFWFYHLQLMLDYAALWPFTAIAVLIGLAKRPEPTSFCICVFATAFLLHSFAGPKSMRYVYYALPFLFVLWGIALAEVGPPLWRFVRSRTAEVLAAVGIGDRRVAGGLAFLLVLLSAMATNGMAIKTGAHLAGVYLPTNPAPPDWAAAYEALDPWLRDADVVLTTSELEALYYLGRYDILISKSRLTELDPANRDFAIDPRTGRPMIGSADAVARVIGCYQTGLIVSSNSRWRSLGQLDHEAANLIVEQARRVDLDARGVRAYVWHHPDGPPGPPEACAALP